MGSLNSTLDTDYQVTARQQTEGMLEAQQTVAAMTPQEKSFGRKFLKALLTLDLSYPNHSVWSYVLYALRLRIIKFWTFLVRAFLVRTFLVAPSEFSQTEINPWNKSRDAILVCMTARGVPCSRRRGC